MVVWLWDRDVFTVQERAVLMQRQGFWKRILGFKPVPVPVAVDEEEMTTLKGKRKWYLWSREEEEDWLIVDQPMQEKKSSQLSILANARQISTSVLSLIPSRRASRQEEPAIVVVEQTNPQIQVMTGANQFSTSVLSLVSKHAATKQEEICEVLPIRDSASYHTASQVEAL
jgi:hypothetical protein